MVDDRTIGGRSTVVGLGLALVAASAGFGALLGATLPAFRGVDVLSLIAFSVPVTPLTLSVYGAGAMGAVLLTFGLVVRVLSRFDDEAV